MKDSSDAKSRNTFRLAPLPSLPFAYPHLPIPPVDRFQGTKIVV
jgi:hypothetical protein